MSESFLVRTVTMAGIGLGLVWLIYHRHNMNVQGILLERRLKKAREQQGQKHATTDSKQKATTQAEEQAQASEIKKEEEHVWPLYFDYNATTPHHPEVIEAMLPYLYTHFGNPSSGHAFGQAANKAVAAARQNVARIIGADSVEEIFFTSCSTEALNWVIKGAASFSKNDGQRTHIITAASEHPSTIWPIMHLVKEQGYQVTFVPVDSQGLISVPDLENAITDKTGFVTLMLANNETGTVQDIAALCRAAKAKNPSLIFHTDASQAVGKIAVNVNELGVDVLTIAGHKLYAPKGVGAQYIRKGVTIVPLMQGPEQERGQRPGTENVLHIVALGKACEVSMRDQEKTFAHLQHMRDRLQTGLISSLSGEINFQVNGPPSSSQRLPNTLSISFENIAANDILDRIKLKIAASAGAACHADKVKGLHVNISPVLKAMKIPESLAMGTIRLSVGLFTTDAQVDICVEEVCKAVRALKNASVSGKIIN